ncbi:MAG TPA: MATE family efflux transporter [Solirubrobacteraceae bacterium]|nr:MATE family efflux transporter [Solirubrobacteraceae bacterium]
MRRRSPYDREIMRLALPALGALAAEPLYLLADTAIVGHLGTPQLAALALAGTVLTGAATFCNFLAYGVTAQVARLHGAGEERRAAAVAAQALWVAVALGVLVAALVAALAAPLISLLGGSGEVHPLAVTFLRIGSIGLPCALVALAGQGYQRGIGDLRSPLVVVVAANVANVALELLFVYGFRWGLAGSAWGTVLAQAGMGAAFATALVRAGGRAGSAHGRRPQPELMRPLLRMGGALVLRTGSLYASFVVAGAVLARVNAWSLGAHQIAMQLFAFLSLVLDAIAIAGQVIVGRRLGAGEADEARAAARRMIELSVAGGVLLGAALLALRSALPHAFTGDPRVLERAKTLWPLLALMQPFGAAVFALDGILLGAGETTYLAWSMLAAGALFAAVSLASLHFGWGVLGIWAGFDALMLVRLATCGARFRGGRWQVVGAD